MRQSSYTGGKIGIGTMVAKRSIIRLTAAFFENVVGMWPAFTGSQNSRDYYRRGCLEISSADRPESGSASAQPKMDTVQNSTICLTSLFRTEPSGFIGADATPSRPQKFIRQVCGFAAPDRTKRKGILAYNFFIMWRVLPLSRSFIKAVGDPARLLFLARIRLWENVVSR